jgi:IclR family transcriptional regulator, acetate operon repressor
VESSVEAHPAPKPVRAAAGERGSVQSVDRALTLLEALAQSTGGTALTDLAARSGLNISTCHHLLATLVKWGYVAKVTGRRYALGARGLHLGQAFLKQVDLPRRAQPFIERISEDTGETVHLAVLQGEAIITLLRREGRHAVRVDTGALGASDAVHATATGKAMLAWLPEGEIRRIVAAKGMAALTPSTITDPDAFVKELQLVRRHGHAMDREEFQPGVICVGAAIRNHLGAVVGAISASAPTQRATDEHLGRMRDGVIAAARALSAEFGEQTGEAGSADASAAPVN